MMPTRLRSPIGKLTRSSSTLPLDSRTVSSWATSETSPSSMNSRSSSPTSRNEARPMPIRSCSVTVVGWPIRWPFTKVPLWLPKSAISYRPLPRLRSSACSRETLRSGTTRSLLGARPMRSRRVGARITVVGRRSTLLCPGLAGTEVGRVTASIITGPSSGWPRRSTQFWVISTRPTRRVPRNVPLVLPLSSRSQQLPSARSTACFQETRESLTTMSDWGSRPTRYCEPPRSVWSVPWVFTTSTGASGGETRRSFICPV